MGPGGEEPGGRTQGAGSLDLHFGQSWEDVSLGKQLSCLRCTLCPLPPSWAQPWGTRPPLQGEGGNSGGVGRAGLGISIAISLSLPSSSPADAGGAGWSDPGGQGSPWLAWPFQSQGRQSPSWAMWPRVGPLGDPALMPWGPGGEEGASAKLICRCRAGSAGLWWCPRVTRRWASGCWPFSLDTDRLGPAGPAGVGERVRTLLSAARPMQLVVWEPPSGLRVSRYRKRCAGLTCCPS